MPRQKGKVPSYCLHKASGRAVVRLNGKDHYLGKFGSEESHRQYQHLIKAWSNERQTHHEKQQDLLKSNDPMITIEAVVTLYRDFASEYYSKDGKPTKEYVDMGQALKPLRGLFGNSCANEFGPRKLKAVRQHMIEILDLSRRVVNNRINRIKRFFRWAVAEELVLPSVIHGLQAVQGLRKGRTKARETEPILPANDEHVEATLPFVSPHVAAMIRLQRITGMRPGEVVKMHRDEIDFTDEVWVYAPAQHKNEYRGHLRRIPLGPKAQAILKPFIDKEDYFFSPKESEEWRNEQRRSKRKSPMTPSQQKRKAKKNPKRAKRDSYDTGSFYRAIKYGIAKANKDRSARGLPLIPGWCPLQIRHSRATELNEMFGIEAAAVSLVTPMQR